MIHKLIPILALSSLVLCAQTATSTFTLSPSGCNGGFTNCTYYGTPDEAIYTPGPQYSLWVAPAFAILSAFEYIPPFYQFVQLDSLYSVQPAPPPASYAYAAVPTSGPYENNRCWPNGVTPNRGFEVDGTFTGTDTQGNSITVSYTLHGYEFVQRDQGRPYCTLWGSRPLFWLTDGKFSVTYPTGVPSAWGN
jgi:hypothetical protein